MSASLFVLEPGLFTTIQDAGRPGHARDGVSAAGAADATALRLANRLAGNPEGAPALEMTLVGGAFRFETPVVVALAGADMEAALDGVPMPPWRAERAAAGAVLRCGAARRGARTVLAVAGGIATAPVLGSCSTHIRSALGGLDGRALRKGDRVPLGAPPAGTVPLRRLSPATLAHLAPPAALRVTEGAQWERFTAAARRAFFEAAFTVSAASDRMGVRLDGAVLETPGGGRMITEGMPLGAIQVPPGGQPVVLFVDHQTTGGYPVIASVIAADLAHVGQLRPGARVRFEQVALDTARSLLAAQEARLAAPDFLPA